MQLITTFFKIIQLKQLLRSFLHRIQYITVKFMHIAYTQLQFYNSTVKVKYTLYFNGFVHYSVY